MTLDDLDRRLLDRIQADFPIEARPFEALARECGVSEDEVIRRVRGLHEGGFVRQISPVFEAKRLGYRSTLCAARVDPESLEAVAQVINAFPEVTHNYLREAHFNVWFTLVVRSDARMKAILDQVRAMTGVEDVVSLPADRMFKISVRFSAGDAS